MCAMISHDFFGMFFLFSQDSFTSGLDAAGFTPREQTQVEDEVFCISHSKDLKTIVRSLTTSHVV